MSIAEYLAAIRRGWLTVIGGALLGVVLAGVVIALSPREYESTATLYIAADSDSQNAQAAYQGSLLSEQRVKSYQQLATSTRLASEVVARLGLTRTPAEVADELSATTEQDTVLLSITATDESPNASADIANAASDTLTRLVAQLEQPRNQSQPPAISAVPVEQAIVPSTYVSPQIETTTIIGLLVGGLVGVTVVFWRTLRDRSIKTIANLKSVAPAPFLGSVLYDSEVTKDALVVLRASSSPQAEAYRQVRTNLQFLNVDRASKVIVMTSSVAGEGKTTSLCNLAVALAQGGTRVVVVDADLRRPSVSEHFSVRREVGLTTVMTGSIGLEGAVQRTRNGIDVLSSGKVPPNPSELLASQQMMEILSDLSQNYEVVLVDAPPLLPVTDATVLAAQCNGAVLACRYGSTTDSEVEQAVQKVESVGVPLIGTIMTIVPMDRSEAAYGYGSYGSIAEDFSREPDHGGAAVPNHRHGGTRPSPRPRPDSRFSPVGPVESADRPGFQADTTRFSRESE